MKKFFKTLMVVVMIFGLTGCVKYNVNMGINADKSVTLEVIYGFNTSLMSSFGGSDESEQTQSQDDYESFQKMLESSDGDLSLSGSFSGDDSDLEVVPASPDDDWSWATDDDDDDESDESVSINKDDFSFLESKGYKVDEYSETTDKGTITGVKITKTFKNIDDITKETEKVVDMVNMFSVENANNFDDSQFFYKKGDNYKASLKFDLSEGESSDEVDASMYESYFDLKYQVTLPTKAVSNNATNVSDDGKTLTWNLSMTKPTTVEFEFNFSQKSNILLYALIGVGVVAVAAVVVVVIATKSKKTPKNNGNNFGGNNMNCQTVPVQPAPTPVPTPMPTPVQQPTSVSSVQQPTEQDVQQPITQNVSQPAHNFCANCGQKTVNGICPNCGK